MSWISGSSLLVAFLQGFFLFLLSPLLVGMERWMAAWLQARPRSLGYLFQPYRDLRKLYGLEPARPETASWFFAAVPPMLFGISLFLLFTLPWGMTRPLLALGLFLLAYLLGLQRFLFSLAGLDGAAPFGGLGGGRAMFINFVVEINFFLFVIALLLSQDDSLTATLLDIVFRHAAWGWMLFTKPATLLLAVVLGILTLYELERVPVGDPASHLELTMSEKALTLGWQGRDLAWIKLAEMMKLTFFMALFVALFLPGAWPWPGNAPSPAMLASLLFFPKLIFVTLAMTGLTATRAKLRLTRIAGPAFFAGALSLLSIVFTITEGFHGK